MDYTLHTSLTDDSELLYRDLQPLEGIRTVKLVAFLLTSMPEQSSSSNISYFCCLVEGIYILLGEEISPEDLQRVDKQLQTFVRNVSALYDACILSMDVHKMTNITSLVERWGPLCGLSLFPFESCNGEILITIHGTGNVCKDIFWHLQAQKKDL
ncbi:hypothetical protein ACJMK2_025281 [Sinanodonta woodiana]|uniref:Uncharacterized protein n=1 Tax=Sinanodonta woodiana TaxID=1069815 RepID=A0ABD3XJT7_SINWO